MAKLQTIQLNELKFYLYQSRAKIDSLYAQIQEPRKTTRTKGKLSWLGASIEQETEYSYEIGYQQKLDAVVKELEAQQLVGAIEERKPYIKGIFPMRWGLYDEGEQRPQTTGPLVYFSCLQDSVLLGLGGSSHHIVGCNGITSTSSRSVTPVLVSFLQAGLETGKMPPVYRDSPREERGHLYEAMALANSYLKGPVQYLEFVAIVLVRDDQCRLEPYANSERGEAILATPLYVSQVHPMEVDD